LLFQSFVLVEATSISMLYGLKLLVICMVTVPAAFLIVLLGLFDRHGTCAYGISRLWAWMVLAIGGVVVKVNGLSRIDPKRQYVFMVNHQSNIDIPVLMQSLPAFQLRWVAKRELLWVPLFGWAMWAAKHITVDRSNRFDALGGLKKARERMKSGVSLVFFPEGTRSSDGNLLPFKRGGFLLAVKTQTPIVPITISGSGTILTKGDWRVRRGKIEVTISAPVSVEDYRPGTLRALSTQVQELIEKPLRATSQLGAPNSGEEPSTTSVRPAMEKRII
jgi:1-acyl-sn-glycerol-3-phosphate acyltransferase